MRLLSFERPDGTASFGVAAGDGVVDLARAFEGRIQGVKALLQAGAVGDARRIAQGRAPDWPLQGLTLLPVIPDPGKVWCCGLNYGEHVRETNREPTDKPMFFLRVADSQVAHGQPLVRPRESTQLDYEAEVAVVIGLPGRRIAEADAWRHVAGYACYNDASVRDWQRHTSQWGPGKNFWRTGAFGPWMVTADEIPFGTVMTLEARLNGQVMQHATTDQMLHSIARQIAYLSTVVPLAAGDVIVTGTPGGVGARREPAVWMKAGDVIEVEIDQVGVLRNVVVDEA